MTLHKSIHGGKVIRISAQAGTHQTMIRVEDTGPGVPIEQQSYLFDLFSGTKREGTGLGLWLCSYIISRNGGRIRYDAQISSGAALEITFPKTE